VLGIDLTRPVSESDRAAMNRAFVERSVLVVREQKLEPVQVAAAVNLFGAIFHQQNTRFAIPDCPQIHYVSNQDKFPDGRRYIPGEGWHTDHSNAVRPPKAISCMSTWTGKRAARWQYLLRPVGHVHFVPALKTTNIGFAASSLLPARAGELLRPYLLARKEGLSATATFATIIVERLLDTVTVLLLFAGYLLFAEPGMSSSQAQTFAQVKLGGAVMAGACLVVLVVLFVLAGHPRVLAQVANVVTRLLPGRLAARASKIVHAFSEGLAIVRQPVRLLLALVFSLPLWLSIATGIWAVTHAFHMDLPFSGAFLIGR